MNYSSIDYIRVALSVEERLAQLAEEATELAHAALKLRRALDKTNPTPVGCVEALACLEEEVADVWLLIEVLGLDKNLEAYEETKTKKLERWVSRLKAERGDPCDA